MILDLGMLFAIVSIIAEKKQGEASQTKNNKGTKTMAKNKYIRVCEKYWLYNEETNTTNYCLMGLTWHTTLQAAQKYYSKHKQKKDLMWSEHGTGKAYLPLYPRLAKS